MAKTRPSERPRAARLPRRQFLSTTIASVTAPLALACGADGDAEDPNDGAGSEAGRHFPQSVASGDPRPGSVILWTRVVDEDADGDLELELELARDQDFTELVELDGAAARRLVAARAADHCVRVRVTGLSAGTQYYYRFVYLSGEERHPSRIGRTKTAPPPDADVAVRFAVVSCQDYSGRYYHVLRRAAELELDFVVHLGDYVYETGDDPDFQSENEARHIAFEDVEGALRVESGGGSLPGTEPSEEPRSPVLAARSLDNYRQLYRVYRSDRDLQRLHERFPFVVVWDDHEFSDDAHGETATYSDGRSDETDPERRANADQAWFEYMPVDYPDGADFEFERDAEFPDNLRIYRDFVFGRHLHLAMTDLRRYRPDHVVPENAHPGAVALTEERLLALLGELPERAEPYVDVDAHADGVLGDELRAAADELAIEPDRLSGNLSLAFVNASLVAIGSETPALNPEANPDGDAWQRGIPYSALGKSSEYASFGARYFVDFEVFGWIAKARYEDTSGASEALLGEHQHRWFVQTLTESDRTWKVWGNEYTLMRRRADLRPFPIPEELRRELLVSADDWDGAPNYREALLAELSLVQNLVVVTGDLHSFFAGHPGVPGGESVIEFVTGAVSSSTYRSILEGAGISVPGLGDLGVAAGLLLQDANPHMAYQELSDNGFASVVADAGELNVSLHQIAFEKLREATLDGELSEHFHVERFRIRSGTATLERDMDGEYRVWSETERRWVLP